MERNLAKMSGKSYDLVVIGGGISGACVAWDAALRGLSVALLEKGDFGSATSAATSKLAHGGLRYLKNLEFGLVRESLQERRRLEMICPHLIYPMPFLVPTYTDNGSKKYLLVPAMILYDLLSYDKARLVDPSRRMPHFRYLSREDVLRVEPGVRAEAMNGGVMYYDAQMLSPDRVTLSFVLSASGRGADVANYAEVTGFLMDERRVSGVQVRDGIDGGEYEVRGRVTVNCSGPWADIVLGLTGKKSDKHVLRSQGIHIITRKITKEHAIVLLTPTGRAFFVLPWRNLTLIGTTDTRYEGDPDKYVVTEEAVRKFIDEVNAAYPSGKLTYDDVLYSYGGLRPIVETDTEVNVNRASRKYEIYDHAKDEGIDGFLTVIGGKYTTSRHLGEQIVDAACAKLGVRLPSKTKDVPLVGGNVGIYPEFVRALGGTADGFSPEIVSHMASYYGTVAREVFELAGEDPALAAPLGEQRIDIRAQIVYACREEMAQTMSDMVLRRTGVGTIGHPGDDVLSSIAEIMARELGWDDARKSEQLQQVDDHLKRRGIGG